ncbi:E3 ubiquitin-protein ligase WAVH1-like [Telopea speciosissima]|uniref:E3 ubiquitin-protein ligase WAVH1-like n=1 Tax=Telopea speciosissima TaxID=54955 RepID=UPI001CC46B82|nr:E3 ubiquitin-protein ligase WAVH1-like [Telopea speciosissima]
MASTWNKLKKTLTLPHSSQSSSISLEVARSSDISEKDFRASTTMPSSSSSSGLRISRTSSYSNRSSKKTCAICLGSMKPGQGKAIFTAECSHAFHFNCIASSVKHGNQLCPICRSKWNDIPFQAPTSVIDPQLNDIGQANIAPLDSPLDEFHASLHRHLPHQPSHHAEPHHFSDDEPLFGTTFQDSTSPSSLSAHPVATVRAFPEFPAVPAADNRPEFAVLVGVKAPALPDNTHSRHAPIDLVTVLDVSGSMAGTKLTLLKRAVHFVIRNLGSADRLAIIAFSSTARRIFPLRRMSDAGRDHAMMAINSLQSTGGTNIVEGLRKGVRVLEERREKNPVASIILLSDGKDTYNVGNHNHRRSSHNQASPNSRRVSDYLSLLPSSICPNNSASREEGRIAPFQVHTFGFGSDHDAAAMHAISDASGGMFSFIQTASIIQDAFARCIGGLLSVFAQELQLRVRAVSPGVTIGSIPAGKYSSEILNQGQLGVVEVGDLYADEEKDFLVQVSVPVFSAEERGETTSLLCVECSYKVPLSQEVVQAESKIVVIRRPGVLLSEDNRMSLEVDRQRNRLWVAEGIAEAQGMAEEGNLEGAQSILAARRSALLASASAQAGDGLCNWLEAELKEIRDRMVSQELYEETGRAYVLSGLSSHSWQRATTRGDSTTHTMVFNRDGDNQNMSGAMGYETPSMVSMVTRSQTINIRTGGSSERVHLLNRACSLVPHR